MVGPHEPAICPKAPHDPEDEFRTAEDPLDDSEEDSKIMDERDVEMNAKLRTETDVDFEKDV